MNVRLLPARPLRALSALLAVLFAIPQGLLVPAMAQTPSVRISVNGGGSNRSSVTGLTFLPTNGALPAPGGLRVRRLPEGLAVPSSNILSEVVGSSNLIRLSFTNSPGPSLPDGNYVASLVTAPTTNPVGPRTSHAIQFHRLFGDRDGDRDVDFADSYWFRDTWLQGRGSNRFDPSLDHDGDGRVGNLELQRFNSNYFTILSAAPALVAHLVWDDGTDLGDAATTRPDISGRVLGAPVGARLLGVVDRVSGSPRVPTFDLTSEVTSSGQFELSTTRLASLAGGSLTRDVPYVLRLALSSPVGQQIAVEEVPFRLVSECPLQESQWQFSVSAVGAGSRPGSARIEDCRVVLEEGDSFRVSAERTLEIPAGAIVLSFTAEIVSLDQRATNRIRDALEAALVDGSGRPQTFTIQGERGIVPMAVQRPVGLPPVPDAFANHVEGLGWSAAPGAMVQDLGAGRHRVFVQVGHLAGGANPRLILRLVNNDGDRATVVRISDVGYGQTAPAGIGNGLGVPALSLLAGSTTGRISGVLDTGLAGMPASSSAIRGVTSSYPAGIVGGGSNPKCPTLAGPLTNSVNGHVYYLLPQSTWTEAEEMAQCLGGHLATIRNLAENQFVFTNFARFGGVDRGLWIGLTDVGQEGNFRWVSGEQSSFRSWAPDEPNNQNHGLPGQRSEFFAHLLPPVVTRVPLGSWNDLPDVSTSDFPLHGVLEFEPESGTRQLSLSVDEPTSGSSMAVGPALIVGKAAARSTRLEPGLLRSSEQWRTQNGGNDHRYLVVATNRPISWSEARVAAMAMGGYLATITSEPENAFVFSLVDRPEFWMPARTNSIGPWVGGYQPEGSLEPGGGWRWVHGEGPFVFKRWADKEPNDGAGAGREEAVAYWAAGQNRRSPAWNDVGEDSLTRSFVVEFERSPDVAGGIGLVRVNDQAVDALDAAGNFFAKVEITPGPNRFEIVASDENLHSVTNVVSVFGLPSTQQFASLGEVSASVMPRYGRTSLRDGSAFLYAELALQNGGSFPVRAPFYVGVKNISDPSVTVVSPDGVSGDGVPYYDFTATLTGGGLVPGQWSAFRTLAFHNPDRVPFTFEYVVLGQLNRPPEITSFPPTDATIGREFTYPVEARDPDDDALTFTLVQRPLGMTIEPATGRLRWTPTVSDRGTHEVEVVVTDTQQASARQRFHVSVTSGGPNRPPIFTSRPVTIARSASTEPAVSVPIDLRRWLPAVQLFTDSQGPARWTVTSNGTVATQELNADASILLSDEVLTQDRLEGSFSVQTTNDDDLIGFVFGYRDAGHFYLFDWKQTSQTDSLGLAQQGMSIKVVHLDSPVQKADIRPTVSPDPTRVRTLYTNGIPYEDFREYRFALEHRPGEIKIEVFDGARLVTSILLNDSTYAPGRFGFYNESQEAVRYSGFSRAPLKDPTYVYRTAAQDPDGDTLTFSLRSGPVGMQMDSRTGVVQWRPAHSQKGSHAVVVEVSDGRGGTARQEFTVCVLPPESLDSTTLELPDLSVSSVDTSAIAFGSDDLRVSGRLSARIQNNGPGSTHAPFDLIVFEDRNRNQAFDRDIEFVLGEAHIPDMLLSGQTATVSVDLRGIVGFAGAPLWAFVDGANTVAETIETNNTRRAICQAVGQVGSFDPHVEWNKSSFSIFPDSKQVMMTPAVMDLNGDGVPEIVFGTTESLGGGDVEVGVLRAVRGDSGNEVFTVTSAEHRINTAASIAVGDIDRDGQPEIIACDASGSRLIAFENDGRFKWRSGILNPVNWGGIAIADLEGDGWAEVVVGRHVLNGTNGILRWAGSGGQGDGGRGPLSLVADVDLDGSPDIVAGNTIYRANGAVLYQNSSLRDGFCALGNFDGDAYPEIVLVTAGHVWLLEHTLAIKWGPVAIPGGGHGGPPTVGDVDGDGRVEIAVAGSSRVVVLGSNGTVKWARETQDGTSNSTGASMFDFDGDGNVELVYRDELFLRVYRGVDGHVLYQIPMSSCTWHEYVLVADADGDGNAEIVAVANQNCGLGQQSGVYVIGDRNDTWVNTRMVWNQHTYHIDNVNEDGTIPLVEEKGWLTHNSYRRNQQTLPGGEFAAPDLVPSFARGVESGGGFTVSLRVGNGGSVAVSAGVAVSIYEGDPRKSAALLAVRRTASRLEPGGFEELSIPFLSRPATNIWIVADDDGSGRGQVTECDEANNAYQTPLRIPATNRVPVVVSTPQLQAQEGSRYSYDVEAADGDLSDPLVFSLGAGPMGMTMDGGSGLIGWTPGEGDQGAHPVQVVVTDSRGGRGYQMFTVTVSNVLNASPVFASSPPGTAVADRNLSYFASARDAEGDPLRFELLVKPEGMVVGPSSGLVTWRPGAVQVGVHEVVLRVGDGRGGFALQTWQQVVSAPNSMPFFVTAPSTTLQVGQDWSYQVQALDPEEDAVVLSMTGSIPAGVQFVATPGLQGSSTMRWTPTVQDIGRHGLELVAVDPRGERAVQTVILEVLPTTANVAPEVVTTPRSRIRHGLAYAQPLLARDANGDTLRFNLIDGPPGMVVLDSRTRVTDPRLASLPAALRPGSQSGLVLWQGSNTLVGTHPVIIEVADGRPGGEVLVTFDLAVVLGLSNSAPSIVSTPMTRATLGQVYAHAAEAFDAEGDLLTWTLGEGPQGMVMDPVSGQIRWLPGEDQVGVHRVKVTVSDDLFGASTQSFEVEVGCANGRPQIVSIPSVAASVGRTYVYAPRAVDPEGDALTWAVVASVPAGMTVDSATGFVQWTPTAAQVGTHVVRLEVSDRRGGNHVQTYSIVVSDAAANRSPVLVGTAPRGVPAGSVYTYGFEATDPDGDTLVGQLLAGPASARIEVQSSEAGRLRAQIVWAPGRTDLGEWEFVLAVRDAKGGSAAQRFSVAVRTNRPPQILSEPGTAVLAGAIYRYDVRALDPDGDPLRYRLESAPPEARITEFGQLTWTTDKASVGSVTPVVVVTDPFGAEVRQRFTVSVSADTRPPVVGLEVGYNLVGQDGSRYVQAGSRVSLRVAATDDVGVASRQLRIGAQLLPLNAEGGATMEFPVAGVFEAVAEAWDASGNVGTAREQIVVIDPGGTNGGGGGIGSTVGILIHSPTNSALVGRLADIVATVTSTRPLTRYAIEYAELTSEVAALEIPVGDPRLVFRPLTNGVFPANTTNTGQRVLGRFDPTLLQNGGYLIRVSAYDVTGQGRQEGAVVEVTGNLKFGEFRMEFADLQIPVAGIPITVRRVYDSRDSGRVGDFGHGWSLMLADPRILETGKRQGAGLDESTMSVRTRVYLTGPDGRRNGYSLVPRFRIGGMFTTVYDMTFRSDPGVYDTLEADDPGGLTVMRDGSIGLALFGGLIGFDPAAYRLKTRDGLVYHYEQPGGLRRVTDLNGNTLTFESDGIRHSSGQQIRFVRDPLGRISRIIDPNGGVLRYDYDGAGDLRSFSDQVTNVTRYAYDPQRPHFLNQIIDPLGQEALNLVYDEDGRLSLVLDASGNPIQQEFDIDQNIGTLTDARGNQTLIHFDERGNESARIVPGISTNRFAYDHNNNLTNSINARGFATNFTYDARGNVTSITDPLTNVTRIAYNDLNKPVRVDNALGQTLHLRYDAAGSLVEVINNAGSRTLVTRDAQGRVASLTDAAGQTTRFDYTDGCACGKPGKVINPDGSFRISEYDSLGNVTRAVNEIGAETLSAYDATGKLLWTRDPLTNYTRYFYNGPLLTNIVDALGRSTRFGYDSLNRTNTIIDAEGGVVRLEYDANGNRTRVVDAVGNATRFVYDTANRLIQQVDPLGQTNFFAYDAEGNRTEARDRNGRKRTFRYDAANRMTNELWWEGTNVVRSITFGFNELGVQTLAVDPAARYEYRYDALNRLERVLAQSSGLPDFTLLYTYTALGQVATVTDHWGVRVSSAYDNRSRLASRTWSSTHPGAGVDPARVDFGYDPIGNRVRTDRYADLSGTNRIGSTTNRYNQAGIVTNITHLGPARQVLAKYDYEFDPAYQIRKWTINNQPSEFGYDRTGQLTNTLNAVLPDETFRFDANGNRVGVQSGGSYAVGGNNQILFDGTNRYAYDAEGNMTSRSNTVTGVLTTYHWDHRNRLISVLDRNPAGVVTQTVAFVYDAMNRRLVKSVATPQGTNVVRFLYNQDDSWADLDSTNTVIARYLHGGRIDELLARQRKTDGRGWYLTDHLGTVRDLANGAGAAIAHVDYSSFGQVIGVSNPGAVDRFGFTGRELDGETGFLYLRARYHSSALGRFIAEDPIRFNAGDPNLLRYVYNSPIGARDPNGTVAIVEYSISVSRLIGGEAATPSVNSYALSGAMVGYVHGFGLTSLVFIGEFLGDAQLDGAYLRTESALGHIKEEVCRLGKVPLGWPAFPQGNVKGFIGGFCSGLDSSVSVKFEGYQVFSDPLVYGGFDEGVRLGLEYLRKVLGQGP